MEAERDQAVQLLNDAKLATDADQKVLDCSKCCVSCACDVVISWPTTLLVCSAP